jgi:hypothetical protein
MWFDFLLLVSSISNTCNKPPKLKKKKKKKKRDENTEKKMLKNTIQNNIVAPRKWQNKITIYFFL